MNEENNNKNENDTEQEYDTTTSWFGTPSSDEIVFNCSNSNSGIYIGYGGTATASVGYNAVASGSNSVAIGGSAIGSSAISIGSTYKFFTKEVFQMLRDEIEMGSKNGQYTEYGVYYPFSEKIVRFNTFSALIDNLVYKLTYEESIMYVIMLKYLNGEYVGNFDNVVTVTDTMLDEH